MSGQTREFLSPLLNTGLSNKIFIPCVSPDGICRRVALEPTHYLIVYIREKWCRQRDLNSRPSDYKSDALPTELYRPKNRYNCNNCTSLEMAALEVLEIFLIF